LIYQHLAGAHYGVHRFVFADDEGPNGLEGSTCHRRARFCGQNLMSVLLRFGSVGVTRIKFLGTLSVMKRPDSSTARMKACRASSGGSSPSSNPEQIDMASDERRRPSQASG
jgi:hypothetical protein